MHAKTARHHEIHNPRSIFNRAMEVFSFPLGFWIKCIVIVERQTVGVLLCFLASIMKEGFVGVNAQARSGWKQGAFFPRPPDVLEVDLDI
ncbi:MAG: hypothetical protein ACPHT8_05600 [Limisphaerales bacterium]|nr:hypothetical protein [Verrucomicrobiota bacterium]